MGRKRKDVNVTENPTPMVEDAVNLPVDDVKDESTEIETENVVEAPVEDAPVEEAPVEENEPVEEKTEEAPLASEPVFKRIQCPVSLVNVRDKPDGEVMFIIRNNSKVIFEGEKDGWVKISGYVMADLVKDL